MPQFQPTHEQKAAVVSFRAGDHIVLQAGAGSGKTSTLRLLAESTNWRAEQLAAVVSDSDASSHCTRRGPRCCFG
ncbi:MAG: hypothetical protein ACRDQ5_11650 [Sciscionella sp.]